MIWRRPRSMPRPVGFAFHEAVDHRPPKIFGTRSLRQFKAGIANGVIDAVDIERVLHHRMADAIAAAGARLVAEQDDLRLGQLDARRARGDGRIEIEIVADVFSLRHRDFAKRYGDAERRGAVRHAHRIVHLACDMSGRAIPRRARSRS